MKMLVRIGLYFIFAAQLSLIGFAQSGIITTYAGPRLPANGSLAVEQAIGGPSSVASDGNGGFYVAGSSQNQVYRVASDGRIRLVAGNGTLGFSGDGGPAVSAQLSYPTGLAVDEAGNLFIADSGNNKIRIVTPEGIIRAVAGTGEVGFSGDGGQATSAKLNRPLGIALDAEGNLFIADLGNNRIRKVTSGGVIKTVAGNGKAGYDDDENRATSAMLHHPSGVAIDAAGNLYIADTVNQRIRKVTTDGEIDTIAGIGSQGFGGDGGQATSAKFNCPVGLALDGTGNLFIADSYNFRIRKITTSGTIGTVAGNGKAGFSGDGGPAASAQLFLPTGIIVNASGGFFIADFVNRRVREVTANGTIKTVAGIGTEGFSGDGGPAASAQLYLPTGLAMDAAGNLFIADASNSRIRKVTPDGAINTVAGNGTAGYSSDGGQATSAELNGPSGVAVDTAGNLFIADYINQRVFKVTTDGVIRTVAGNGAQGYSGDGGPATSAQLNEPWGVAVDMAGNLFITDLENHCVRMVTPGGMIHTVAGMGTAGFSGDGGPATSAQLKYPVGVALDATGNLFIADSGNHRIRMATPGGTISTVAGNGSPGFSGDGGQAASAQLYRPTGVAIDAAGNLFIVDHNNNRIRKVASDGMIGTVAGIGTAGFSGDDGPAASAQLNYPMDITVDNEGSLFVADYNNSRIRKVK